MSNQHTFYTFFDAILLPVWVLLSVYCKQLLYYLLSMSADIFTNILRILNNYNLPIEKNCSSFKCCQTNWLNPAVAESNRLIDRLGQRGQRRLLWYWPWEGRVKRSAPITHTDTHYLCFIWLTHTQPQPCTGLPLGVKMVWGMPCPGCDLTTFQRSKVTCANVSMRIKGASVEISQTCTIYRSLFLVIADINTLLSFTFITDILSFKLK